MLLNMEYGQSDQIYSVSALTELLRNELERKFPFVWVRGEVTDYSLSNSGHMYFSLKDANSLLQCVWFAGKRRRASSQNFDPLTGEVFEEARPDMEELMRNGLELICAGGINLYAKSGRYQLIVEYAELSGQGALALELERRKAKYAALGYFALERKRALPVNPLRIALVTSPQGAAIHDFLKLASMRGLSSTIRIFPVTVQGKGAAAKMAQAIEEANGQAWAEVIVLIRGGGSAEDLMEFNEPVLVEAIFNSRIPVLAGIGHEVDVFLSDMTADARAATPSHAAQILWPLRGELWQKLDDLDMALNRRAKGRLELLEERLAEKGRALGWLSPLMKIKRLEARMNELELGIRTGAKSLLARQDMRLDRAILKMGDVNVLLNRMRVLREKLAWLDKSASLKLEKLLEGKGARLEDKASRLEESVGHKLASYDASLLKLDLLLRGLNPLAPLEKGYALLTDGKGIVHSIDDCRPGQELSARLLDGTLELIVKAVHKNEETFHD